MNRFAAFAAVAIAPLVLAMAVPAAAAPLARRLSVVASGLSQSASELSGGNQQKVTVARALARDPKLIVAITPTRGIFKADMVNNDALPDIHVDPETFAITIGGDLVEPQPATELPLAQLYSLF